MPSYVGVALCSLIGLVFICASLIGASVLRPKRPAASKTEAYESGMPAVGDTRGRHEIRFYMVAMLFVVFDLELAFLYPWAVWFAGAQTVESKIYLGSVMAVFIALLGIADIVAWKLGVFDWGKRDD